VALFVRASQGSALNGKPEEGSRDVAAVLNMIRRNLFGDVVHCVGGPEHLESIKLFLGLNRTDHFTEIAKIESAGIMTTLLKTARGKTVTIYDDRSADRPYARMFRVEGTRGVWIGDQHLIHLHGISPIGAWEDFGKYRDRYSIGSF
jgi:hypothetical protein